MKTKKDITKLVMKLQAQRIRRDEKALYDYHTAACERMHNVRKRCSEDRVIY